MCMYYQIIRIAADEGNPESWTIFASEDYEMRAGVEDLNVGGEPRTDLQELEEFLVELHHHCDAYDAETLAQLLEEARSSVEDHSDSYIVAAK